jgi:2'-5' RNA ligase
VPGTVVLKASDAAAKVKASPFAVMFNRVESFSGRDGHYPLVLRGDDGVVGLEMLNRSLAVSMRMMGLKASLNFTPHLTLSYVERPIKERLIPPVRWTVREFALVHSLIGETKYIRLGCWSLGA